MLVVVTLDPHGTREATIHLDLDALGAIGPSATSTTASSAGVHSARPFRRARSACVAHVPGAGARTTTYASTPHESRGPRDPRPAGDPSVTTATVATSRPRRPSTGSSTATTTTRTRCSARTRTPARVTVRTLRPLGRPSVVDRGPPTARRYRCEHEHRRRLRGHAAGGRGARTTGSRSPTTAGPSSVDDPYRFLPTLGEIDLHLIGEGRHETAVDGARRARARYDGAARRRRRHLLRGVGAERPGRPRRRRLQPLGRHARTRCARWASSGVWELFVPGLGDGHALQVRDARPRRRLARRRPTRWPAHRGPAGHRVRRRSARRTSWADDDWMAGARRARPARRADEHLRGAPRLVAARADLPRARRRAHRLRRRPGLHPRRAHAA